MLRTRCSSFCAESTWHDNRNKTMKRKWEILALLSWSWLNRSFLAPSSPTDWHHGIASEEPPDGSLWRSLLVCSAAAQVPQWLSKEKDDGDHKIHLADWRSHAGREQPV